MNKHAPYTGSGTSRRERRLRKAQTIKNIKTPQSKSNQRFLAGGLVSIAVLGTGLYFGGNFATEAPVEQKQSQAVQQVPVKDSKVVPVSDTKSKDEKKPQKDFKKESKAEKSTKNKKVSLDNLPAFVSSPPAEASDYGTIRIPALGSVGEKALVEGYKPDADPNTKQPEIAQLNDDLLDNNDANHYASTDQPGQVGNFVVSGHRNGPGAPFNEIDELDKGDVAHVINDKGDTYTYSVIKTATQVELWETGVLDSDPFSKYVNNTKQYMTITTCGDWNSDIRVYAVLELKDFTPAK